MRIDFIAPAAVQQLIASLGRTEDVRFSPDCQRLAVAGFASQEIAIFDIQVQSSPAGKQIYLSSAANFFSAELKNPHGLDFIDNETLVVANRNGHLNVFKLPQGEDGRVQELHAIQTIESGESNLLWGPGSVAIANLNQDRCAILVCNNYGNQVTRHILDCQGGYAVKEEEALLSKWLDVPDGISVSHSGQWLAISNHNTHSVLLYENSLALHPHADPQGVLRGIHYPHGVRFTQDGQYILVADAGAPYLHIYFQPEGDWRGVQDPSISLRVMEETTFQLGRHNPQEGGPKGIDIDCATGVLVATSEFLPLAFFDFPQIVTQDVRSSKALVFDVSQPDSRTKRDLDIQHELEKQQALALNARKSQVADNLTLANDQLIAQVEQSEARAVEAEGQVQALLDSHSWWITAPLRWVTSTRQTDR